MNPNPHYSALPLIVQEFIDGIVHKMGYRKSVRQEVHQELTAHFSDALRDCTDPTHRQQRAESLLADFGDAALAEQGRSWLETQLTPLVMPVVVSAVTISFTHWT